MMFNWLKSKPVKPKSLGQYGEEVAQEEYKKRGYKIIAANFFNKKGLRLGEIDFIATDAKTIVFVEVKTRSSRLGKFGTPEESVNVFKQRKILKAVKLFIISHQKYAAFNPRIDVCVIIASAVDKHPESVTILPSAVEDWNWPHEAELLDERCSSFLLNTSN